MKKTESYLLVTVVAVVVLAAVVWQGQVGLPTGENDNLGDGDGGDTYYFYEQPDTTPPPAEADSEPPSSLMVSIEPNPVVMGSNVYGEVVSDGYKYPITVHVKHVGSSEENSFGARLDEDGQFWHSQIVSVPGYYDFWVTSDNGVSSNTPRLTVEGAMLVASRTFCSRLMDTMDVDFKLFCHSAGSATVFVNDGSSSIPIGTVHINSGGYGTLSYDFSSWTLGSYEVDFVVNGIKASDYGESVALTLGR